MSVQKERRKAMICGPIVFRNALGTRRSLPMGPCELAVGAHGVQRIILKIGELELNYHVSQSYIDECVRKARLVVERLENASRHCKRRMRAPRNAKTCLKVPHAKGRSERPKRLGLRSHETR